MIFNEICDNIIEIGILEFYNEMATYNDYILYESYFTEASSNSGNKKKNMIAGAFDAIINMFKKLGEKIASLFGGDKSKEVDSAINALNKTSEGKTALSKKINFKSFKAAKKLDQDTAQRISKAKSPEEVDQVMSGYRKRRNRAVKVASVALGAIAAISVTKYISGLNKQITDTNIVIKKNKDRIQKSPAPKSGPQLPPPKSGPQLPPPKSGPQLPPPKSGPQLPPPKSGPQLTGSKRELLPAPESRPQLTGSKRVLLPPPKEQISNQRLTQSIATALSEVYKNQAESIKEEAIQQNKVYNYILKLSKSKVKKYKL